MLPFFMKFFPCCQFQTLLQGGYPWTAESKVNSSMFALLCYDAQTPSRMNCLVTKHLFVSMAKEFQLHRVFQSDNIEKSDQKRIKS